MHFIVVPSFLEDYLGRAGAVNEPAAVTTDHPDGRSSTSRTALIGTAALTALVVAGMVGAGVFTTSGFLMADVGDPWWVLGVWGVGGGVAVFGAMAYGQLAGRIAENGGEYLYLSRSVHPAAGFVAGVVSMTAGFTGSAAYAALAFEAYAGGYGSLGGLPDGAVAIGVVGVATVVHAVGAIGGARVQAVVVAVKLGLVAAFLGVAFWSVGDWRGGAGQGSGLGRGGGDAATWGTLATSLMWVSLSYSGFNAAIYVAGEAKDGAAGVRRAMVVGTVVVTSVYLLLNAVFVFAPDAAAIAGQEAVALIAADVVGGERLAGLVRVVVCLGLATGVSASVLAGPRVYLRMIDDGWFPPSVGRWMTLRRAVVLQGVAVAALVPLASLRGLLSYLGMTLAACSAATVATLIPGGMRERSWSVAVPVIYVAATIDIVAVTAWNKPGEAVALGATTVVGVVGYAISRRFRD